MLMAMYFPILGDPGASSRDDAIFSGEKLQQERETFARKKQTLAWKFSIVSTSRPLFWKTTLRSPNSCRRRSPGGGLAYESACGGMLVVSLRV